MPLERVLQPGNLARDESQEYLWTMNFGPQHPATHTTLRIVLKLDGERVVDAMPDIGYLHSGFEKLGEELDYNQYVTVTDRMNYISPMCNNVAWHMAVEKLTGIEVPPRCQYLRVIVAELARIADHLVCNGAVGLDTGAFTYFLYAFNPREKIYDIFEALCGARFTNSFTRVGGLMRDASPEAIRMIREVIRDLPKALDDMERLLNRNKIFVDRTKGVGVLSKGEAIRRSVTGPIARASGVTRDLRKDEPYLCYGDFDFQACCARAGDCYARYLVRMDEMRESLKIVEQAVENLPQGPVSVGMGERASLPNKGMVYSTIEGLITHFELVMSNRGFEVPCEEVYCATEAPNGELGFYLVGDGTNRAYRARCRPPSFIHFALFPHLIRGHTLSDVVAVLGSLNVIAAELDRQDLTSLRNAAMLKQISIEGYKSIRSMSLELRPLNVLIGANGAGKSNFLSFSGLLKSVVDKKFQLHVGHVGGAESILFGGVKRTQEIKASMVLEDADTERTYKLKWMFSMPDSLRFARETVLFAKETVSYPDETKNAYCIDMLDSHGPDARLESGIRDRAARGDEHAARFQHLFGTSYVYHFADTSYAAAFQHQCYIHDNRRLAPDGRNLAAMLYRYRHTAPERYERLLWTIKQVAPWFDDFSVEPLALNPGNVMLNWRHVGFDMEFGPHQLPGGGFRAFALVTLLLQPIEDLPDLLLIDEPELGLHPEAVAIVASLIHQVSHYTQVLVATQSTGLLDHFEPEDVVVVDLKDNASVFRHLEREELAEWVDDFALSELWEKNYLGGGPGA